MAEQDVVALAARVQDADARLAALERKLDEREALNRVRNHLQTAKLSSAYLKTAPNDYYSWSLEKRA